MLAAVAGAAAGGPRIIEERMNCTFVVDRSFLESVRERRETEGHFVDLPWQ